MLCIEKTQYMHRACNHPPGVLEYPEDKKGKTVPSPSTGEWPGRDLTQGRLTAKSLPLATRPQTSLEANMAKTFSKHHRAGC